MKGGILEPFRAFRDPLCGGELIVVFRFRRADDSVVVVRRGDLYGVMKIMPIAAMEGHLRGLVPVDWDNEVWDAFGARVEQKLARCLEG